MPGIEPGASRMLSARSTTELHPLICNFRETIVITDLPVDWLNMIENYKLSKCSQDGRAV